MTMPIDLVLVRHGQSEGNLANQRSRKGDDSAFTDEFLNRHSSTWRLTDRGRKQARLAGEWIRQNLGPSFDRYYTSEYLRAMETAAGLDLPNARWYREFYLRERDYGELDVMPQPERLARFADLLARRQIDGFYWCPPGGESMAGLCLRIDRVLNTLHRECSDKRVIIVCHGEVIWAFRIRLERLSQERYRELDASRHPFDHVHNGQILHYTRRNPDSGQLARHANWIRSAVPDNPQLAPEGWQEIVRPSFSNNELLVEVNRTPQEVK